MLLTVTTRIDENLCTGCGRCVAVCPSDTLALVGGKARVVGSESLGCGHCQAVCPEGAVTVGSLAAGAPVFATFASRDEWLPYGKSRPADLVRLMSSRRSCRNFRPGPVELAVLEDLVRIGTTAPSGSNAQAWTFAILPDRPAVEKLGRLVAGFYRNLNLIARQPAARLFGRVFLNDALGRYWRDYYPKVQAGLEEYERGGRDRLLHGAPAAIVIGSRPGGTTPVEDASLAAMSILLAAHTMGYGTCLIGFAVEAFRRDRRIGRTLGFEPDEQIHAVIAIGRPAEKYTRTAGRRSVSPRIVRG